MKSLLIISLLLLLGISSIAQENINPKISGRKIEVVAYSSEEVLPNAINASFVLTEYTDNGKKVSIEQSIENIKKIIKKLNCDASNLSVGNIYGYLNNNESGAEFFDHKIQYIMKFQNSECIHKFLEKIDKRSLQSFNIDEMFYEGSDSVLRLVQVAAYKRAINKAEAFLKLYGEERGKLLEIVEINRFETMPDFTGKGAAVKSVHANNGISTFESNASRSKYIKIEYVAKVVFEIK